MNNPITLSKSTALALYSWAGQQLEQMGLAFTPIDQPGDIEAVMREMLVHLSVAAGDEHHRQLALRVLTGPEHEALSEFSDLPIADFVRDRIGLSDLVGMILAPPHRADEWAIATSVLKKNRYVLPQSIREPDEMFTVVTHGHVTADYNEKTHMERPVDADMQDDVDVFDHQERAYLQESDIRDVANRLTKRRMSGERPGISVKRDLGS